MQIFGAEKLNKLDNYRNSISFFYCTIENTFEIFRWLHLLDDLLLFPKCHSCSKFKKKKNNNNNNNNVCIFLFIKNIYTSF